MGLQSEPQRRWKRREVERASWGSEARLIPVEARTSVQTGARGTLALQDGL